VYLAALSDTEGELRSDGTEIAEAAWFRLDALPPLSRSAQYILRSIGVAG
jgi:NADH pyrophosphatase NudC (nudix superfamily)